MAEYMIPVLEKPKKLRGHQVVLVASGDLRESANRVCWKAQSEMEASLRSVVESFGYDLVRAHGYRRSRKHGFIGSQREGMEVFAKIDPDARLIVAEAVW